jgi:hypothetical protein
LIILTFRPSADRADDLEQGARRGRAHIRRRGWLIEQFLQREFGF